MKFAKTTYERLGFHDCPKCFPGEIVEATEEEAVSYLHADVDHAILFLAHGAFIAIWRGTKDLNTFQVQDLPLETPKDIIGMDLSARSAISLAQEFSEEINYAEGLGHS